ncbi:MAG: hypothetical protein ACR2OE_00700 [Thermomicrobiales bacterium]
MLTLQGLIFIIGIAMALIMVLSQTATFETISSHDTASASSLYSTMRQFASAAGVALLSTVLATRINANISNLDAAATPITHAEAMFSGYAGTWCRSGDCRPARNEHDSLKRNPNWLALRRADPMSLS